MGLDGGLRRWTDGSWQYQASGVERVAVDIKGQPWVLDPDGTIRRRDPQTKAWIPLPGAAMDIATGSGGSVWIVGKGTGLLDFPVYFWNGKDWTPVGGEGVAIAAP